MRLPRAFSIIRFTILLVVGGVSAALCQQSPETTERAISSTPDVAVGSQYDTTHVYIAPQECDGFVSSERLTATKVGHVLLPFRPRQSEAHDR